MDLEKKYFLPALLLSGATFVVGCGDDPDDGIGPLTQKEVLTVIFDANPGNTLNWELDAEIATWEGVGLDWDGQVVDLDLQGKGLATLPEAMGQLTGLVSLNLTNNRLEKVPASIGQLAGLVSIYADYNRLESLPQEIASLTKLKSVPTAIGQLNGLTFLNLVNNELESIPFAVCALEGTETFIFKDEGVTCAEPGELGQQCTVR